MNYPFQFWGNFYGIVSIYGMDGTVAITHGAIEMGQGVNTKVRSYEIQYYTGVSYARNLACSSTKSEVK